MKEVVVISLGGSLIIPDEIGLNFLKEFKKVILRHSKKYKFVIVCGGGSIARKYINALKASGINKVLQSYSGISATRMNARFLSYFFNQDCEQGVPERMRAVKEYLKRKNIVFCGALEYRPNQTSDSTSAEIARELGTVFINLTNTDGLYDRNPLEFKNAKFISRISWKDFDKMTHKKKFVPGQHFVLDQNASRIIMKNKIKTYIMGKNVRNLDNFLKNKSFKGTEIFG